MTCLVKRWEHHTPSGGYDRLAQAVGCRIIGRAAPGGFPSRIVNLLVPFLVRPDPSLLDYRREDWLAEWKLIASALVRPPDVVHVLYGDEQLDVLLKHRRLLNCPLVATFHLPTSRRRVRERFERQPVYFRRRIDAAVVVARCQLADFQQWLGHDRVFYIPHGIDTHTFCPGETRFGPGNLHLLVVGEHLRDFPAIHGVIEECNRRGLPVNFDLVVPPKCGQPFHGGGNVRFHSGVSEAQLIDHYRQADALLLPVTDATANNSILEAMACGTPVISTATGGIPDYVDENSGWLFSKGEVTAIVDLIGSACANREVFRSRRAMARSRALMFDWNEIKSQLDRVYELLADSGGGKVLVGIR